MEYISSICWRDGFIWAHCECRKAWITKRHLFYCSHCRRDISITVGTVFENIHEPSRLWFHVMWLMMSQKTGVSAKNLKDSMRFGSYQTIWSWLHKLRSLMVRLGRELLTGTCLTRSSLFFATPRRLYTTLSRVPRNSSLFCNINKFDLIITHLKLLITFTCT